MNKVFVSRYFQVTFSVIQFFAIVLLSNSCAYKLSNKVDTLPKNVKAIYIPLFKNNSSEPLVETIYTDSLRSEALRSGYAQVVNSESDADAVMYGTVRSVEVVSDQSVVEPQSGNYLPNKTVLSAQAKVTVAVDLVLKKKGSSEILWAGSFTQARNYTPPQLTLPTINSANSLYNLSVRRQTLSTLSKEMMQLAFDRLVDNF